MNREARVAMKQVTKNNLLKLIDLKKDYIEGEEKDKELLQIINNFISNVINKDRKYFNKLRSYDFNSDQLKHLM